MFKFYINNLFGKREVPIYQKRKGNEECVISRKINQTRENLMAIFWNEINKNVEKLANYLVDPYLQDLKDANEKQARISNDFDITISGDYYQNLGQEKNHPRHKAELVINMSRYSPYVIKTTMWSSNLFKIQYNLTNWNCPLSFLPRFKLWRLDSPPYPSIPLNIEIGGLYNHNKQRLELSTAFLLANIAKAECALYVGEKIGLTGNLSFAVSMAMAHLYVKENSIEVVGRWKVKPDLAFSLALEHSMEFDTVVETVKVYYQYSNIINTLSVNSERIVSYEVGLASHNRCKVELQYNLDEKRIGFIWAAGADLGRKTNKL